MSQIFRWSPTIRVKDNGDKYGVFQCKCAETTPGAKRHVGETPMVKWDFWAIDCGSIQGRLVWIDKNFMEFNGKTKTSLTLAFKTIDGEIDILSMPFDGFSLRNVMNHLCGMGDSVYADVIKLTYGVWKKKDEGKPVLGNNGEQIWNSSLNFDGVTPMYPLSKESTGNYWDLRKQKGIEPIKSKNRKGEDVWDDSAEMAFWDKPLVGLQKKLVAAGIAIPFSYNSWICGDIENPSGGGNQPEDIKEAIKGLYESEVKGKYQYFNAGNGIVASAEDVRANLRNPQPASAPAQSARAITASAIPLDDDFPNYDSAPPIQEDSEDLPF